MAAMNFSKRILAPIVFAWMLATAGMAAVAYTATPEAPPVGEGAGARIVIGDIQVGERGNQTRIAFLCDGACILEKREADAFYLSGVDASFILDLSRRSKRVQSLRAIPQGEGSMLRIRTDAVIDHTRVKPCTVGGRDAACLDLFFVAATQKNPPPPSKRIKPAQQASASSTAAPQPAKPVLREGAPERFKRFAQLAAPERLSPPAGVILAKVQPIEPSVVVRKPAIRKSQPLVEPVVVDFTERVKTLLNKDLSSAFCNNAAAALQADAWALGAMVDVGLCAAARGDVVQGDVTLARLLEYTPDNYEALVGRALIAEQAKEKGVALKYFQDALNSLPPIEESNRIVQAMAALD
ncbi:hypothetical protein MNBD_ALPHA05-1110 [hydrothermal vent metagenome]|uniref:Uncharacterized protein n=1 Tax=hydrothermal vent metagenome TaxID=652676 RepID=A0A3B0SXX9_9ZZZZ